MFSVNQTPFEMFVVWQLVSTPILGYHQAIIQENECIQKLNTIR